MFDQSTKTWSEEDTQKLYELGIKLIEFAESKVPKFSEQGEDRMTLALSPIFAALFAQAKHRYRPTPAASVIVTATMIRNFALQDDLSELGLVDAVCEFMHMMIQQQPPTVITEGAQ